MTEREKIAVWLEAKAAGHRQRRERAIQVGDFIAAQLAEEMAREAGIYAHDIRQGAHE